MRKYYIDNLRWTTILLLIPYHAAMAWNVCGEPNYIYYGSSQAISSIVVFLSPYLMPLMFLIAGISARSALQKRTIGQYILERSRRLLVPFITGTILIMPLMTYIADRFNYGYQGGLLRHYTVFFTRFTDLTGSDGGFSVGQFWFLLYLFVMSLITAGVASLQGKIIPEKDAGSFGLISCMGVWWIYRRNSWIWNIYCNCYKYVGCTGIFSICFCYISFSCKSHIQCIWVIRGANAYIVTRNGTSN